MRVWLAGVLSLVLMLGACGALSGEPDVDAEDVRAWGRSFSPRLIDLGRAMEDLGPAIARRDFAAISEACDAMALWSDDMDMSLPVPDPDADEHWQRLVDLTAEAAEACTATTIDRSDESALRVADLTLAMAEEAQSLVADMSPYLDQSSG